MDMTQPSGGILADLAVVTIPDQQNHQRQKHQCDGQQALEDAVHAVLPEIRNGDLNELITYGKANKKGHDIYMIGNLASGKTTIIHKLLKNYKNNTKWTIKTETYKGTNVKVLSIPLTNSSFLYELPGLSLTTSVLGKVEKEVFKSIVPVKKIKATTYPLTVPTIVKFLQ